MTKKPVVKLGLSLAIYNTPSYIAMSTVTYWSDPGSGRWLGCRLQLLQFDRTSCGGIYQLDWRTTSPETIVWYQRRDSGQHCLHARLVVIVRCCYFYTESLLTGGNDDEYNDRAEIYSYNPDSEEWEQKATLNKARSFHAVGNIGVTPSLLSVCK